jgi:hypothetical protein
LIYEKPIFNSIHFSNDIKQFNDSFQENKNNQNINQNKIATNKMKKKSKKFLKFFQFLIILII